MHYRCTNLHFHYPHIVNSCLVAAQICIIIICILCNVHPCICAVTNLYYNYLHIVHCAFTALLLHKFCILIISFVLCNVHCAPTYLYFHFLQIVHSCFIAAQICTIITYILCIWPCTYLNYLQYIFCLHALALSQICTSNTYISCSHALTLQTFVLLLSTYCAFMYWRCTNM